MTDQELISVAAQARENAYAPYSRHHVGAALLARSGRVYTGCNVENAAFSLTICAERTAICKAISEGEREFDAIAVVTPHGATPCGACRQMLAEFGLDIRVLTATPDRQSSESTVSELLPGAFTAGDLP